MHLLGDGVLSAGRLCMLAVPLCLWWEAQYKQDINAQVGGESCAVVR